MTKTLWSLDFFCLQLHFARWFGTNQVDTLYSQLSAKCYFFHANSKTINVATSLPPILVLDVYHQKRKTQMS